VLLLAKVLVSGAKLWPNLFSKRLLLSIDTSDCGIQTRFDLEDWMAESSELGWRGVLSPSPRYCPIVGRCAADFDFCCIANDSGECRSVVCAESYFDHDIDEYHVTRFQRSNNNRRLDRRCGYLEQFDLHDNDV
jgi:hypothetical protein